MKIWDTFLDWVGLHRRLCRVEAICEARGSRLRIGGFGYRVYDIIQTALPIFFILITSFCLQPLGAATAPNILFIAVDDLNGPGTPAT